MDVETAHQRAAEGMQFLAVGSELRMMTQQAQEVVENLIPEAVASDVARY